MLSSQATAHMVRLSRTQRAFVEDLHVHVLFIGGPRAGKAYAGAARAMRRFGQGPPSLGLAASYPMLRDATWRTALDVWAPLIERVVGAVAQAFRHVNGFLPSPEQLAALVSRVYGGSP